ncbi:MAG: iron chelate uptake ABC transporter family permease subunit [Lachnospiraceae bacterium]|nr:iron chelate uptake ABC transporter family permease subunit [Lachnospiraceae bacterium]MDY5741941.1 iron chelate uptake ABC transporter family permease subunit [Lachnospiraceae bacterium]
MDWSVFREYSFIIVALGTVLLAMAAGMVGTVTMLKGQSLIGDAIGHASLPGIILAFMLSGQKRSTVLLGGAIVAGMIGFLLVQLICETTKIEADTAMAVILSAMFGLGMVLNSHIQGNAAYQKASQSGLKNYIFGQAAYLLREDVVIIFVAAVLSLTLFVLFYKEIKVYVFDASYAATIGIRHRLMSVLIMLMTMLLIAAGLKSVGAILICSMLINPAIIGLQWSKRYGRVLVIAAAGGGLSALVGTAVSSQFYGFSTGPSITLCMSALAVLSVLFGPRGVIFGRFGRRQADKYRADGRCGR